MSHFQVSFFTSYSNQNQLLTFHAHLWSHLWHRRQILRNFIQKITWTSRGNPRCCLSNPSSIAAIHLSSPFRIHLLSHHTLPIQMIHTGIVAADMFFCNVNMDIWKHVHYWEESVQKIQYPILDCAKIQETSKHHYINLVFLSALFNHTSVCCLITHCALSVLIFQ